MSVDRFLPLLRVSRLFGGLDEQQLLEFARAAHCAQYVSGDYLWHAGQPALAATIIVSGLVKICRPQRHGASTILGLFGPRESVGDVALVSGKGYPADALAASDAVEVLRIERRAVIGAMERVPEVGMALNRSLIEHTDTLRGKIDVLTAGPVECRLYTLITYLAERFGDEMEDGSVEIPVALSRADLAGLVSTTVETTIRVMSRWQKANLLATSRRGFLIRDLDALGASAEPS